MTDETATVSVTLLSLEPNAFGHVGRTPPPPVFLKRNIGSQIEHMSERTVLDRLVGLLTHGQRETIILSNISLGARQIDFVAALDDLALVSSRASGVEPRGDADAVLVLDETGFKALSRRIKKDQEGSRRAATPSACHAMTAAPPDGSRIARSVFFSATPAAGHALIDRALYLPPSWTDDSARCAAAGVPKNVCGLRQQAQIRAGEGGARPGGRRALVVGSQRPRLLAVTLPCAAFWSGIGADAITGNTLLPSVEFRL